MSTSELDRQYLGRAVQLALKAGAQGNLPIGAVLCLDGEIVAEGMNAIWRPAAALTRHAEMEALRAAPSNLWARARAMTLYTTLEPCLMCAGAILLHQIGRLVFGASDPYGGVHEAAHSLPGFFREQMERMEWMGPALPEECDALYTRARELEHERQAKSQAGRAEP